MYRWNILGEFATSENFLDKLLSVRGISKADEFLNPPSVFEHVKRLPRDFKDSLLQAKALILAEIAKNTPIIIYGDYDADGICGTAILYNTLTKELGYQNCRYFIPNRFDHGYGLSKEGINKALADIKMSALFITVDSGITSAAEVTYIHKLGHKVIITDHHQKPATLPAADSLVWNDSIVGASIAWILARVLGSKNAQSLALAALATVTDVQPLLDMNRAIVKEGLAILNSNPPLGIAKLLELSGVMPQKLTTYELGWVLGPRINASGRLETALDSLKLFIEDNPQVVGTIAKNLNDTNVLRQNKTSEMYALTTIPKDISSSKVIFSVHEDYHEGIIGLVASKFIKDYYLPAVVISLGEEFGKGSVRSIPGIDIISILRRFENLFENLGGHPMAAGFTIKKDNIALLEGALREVLEREIASEVFQPVLDIDLSIPLEILSFDILNQLEKLRPFGVSNKEPIFLSSQVGILDMSSVGKSKTHAALKLFDGTDSHKAIFFGGAEKVSDLSVGDKVDVVYALRRNVFNGFESLDLVVKDIRKN